LTDPFPDSLRHLAEIYWSGIDPGRSAEPNDITVVTGFFDIGRGDWSGSVQGRPIPGWLVRSSGLYMDHFRLLARLRNQMVVFTDRGHADAVLAARKAEGLEALTQVVVIDRPFRRDAVLAATKARIAGLMDRRLKDFVTDPTMPEVWSPEYVLVTVMKPLLVLTALDLGLVSRPQVAWLDFGYCRDAQSFNPAYPWHFDCGSRLHLFAIAKPDGRSPAEMVRTGYCPIQGAQIFGPADLWRPFWLAFRAAFTELLAADLVDDDQGPLLMASRAAPELFEVHSVSRRDRYCALRLFNSAVPPDQIPPPPRRSRRTPWQRILNEFERFARRFRAA
jgi:protein YibB